LRSILRSIGAGIAMLTLGTVCAFAQGNTGMVTVRVVDAQTGKSVPGVTVNFDNRNGDEHAEKTDRFGMVRFFSVGVGRAAAMVKDNGYQSCLTAFDVSADQESAITLDVVHKTTDAYQVCRRSTLVQPGISSDVYNIF
jgi:hypothetical protein